VSPAPNWPRWRAPSTNNSRAD